MSNISFQYEMLHKSLEIIDDDLAIQIIMSGLSNNPLKIIKQFSIASELMIIRSETKENLNDYNKKLLETTTYTLSGVYKNFNSNTDLS